MNRLFLYSAIVLLFAAIVYGQSSELKIQYGRIEDRTNVSIKLDSVKGANLYTLLYFNHKGIKLSEPVTHVGLMIHAGGSFDWKYLKAENLRLFILADGERFYVDGKVYDSKVNSGYSIYSKVTVSERVRFAVSLQQLRVIATAKAVELQLGRDQFRFSDKTARGIREMVAKIDTEAKQ